VRAAYQDPKASAWLSERTGVPAVRCPSRSAATAREGPVRAVRLDHRQAAGGGEMSLRNWDGLDCSILGPACLAGLIVLSTHVPLGKQVLARGIIFIDLAIAQIAALGVIAAVSRHRRARARRAVAAAVAALLGAGC
jgi:hypothetical protein